MRGFVSRGSCGCNNVHTLSEGDERIDGQEGPVEVKSTLHAGGPKSRPGFRAVLRSPVVGEMETTTNSKSVQNAKEPDGWEPLRFPDGSEKGKSNGAAGGALKAYVLR